MTTRRSGSAGKRKNAKKLADRESPGHESRRNSDMFLGQFCRLKNTLNRAWRRAGSARRSKLAPRGLAPSSSETRSSPFPRFRRAVKTSYPLLPLSSQIQSIYFEFERRSSGMSEPSPRLVEARDMELATTQARVLDCETGVSQSTKTSFTIRRNNLGHSISALAAKLPKQHQ